MTDRWTRRWGALLGAWSLFGCAGRADGSAANAGNGGQSGASMSDNGGFGGRSPSSPTSLVTSAWDIRVSAAWRAPDLNATTPEFALTLGLDAAAELSGRLSKDGSVSTFPLRRQSGSSASVIPSESGVRFSLPAGEGALTALTIDALTVTAFDDDADGIADRLTGVGEGEIEQSCGDCYFSKAVHLTLLGKPDQTPPTLRLPGGRLNPLDRVALVPSESLRSVQVALTSLEKAPQVVPLIFEGAVASQMFFTTAQVLPFSGAWQVTGTGQDFAGHGLDLTAARLSTIADPGYFAQDGFESTPNLVLDGDAAFVDISSGLPIPNGKRALLLPPGSTATFHLRRASQTAVLANVVELSDVQDGSPYVSFQSAVIGGAERVVAQWAPSVASLPTGNAVWIKAGTARTIKTVLNEAGSELAVTISSASCTGGGACPPFGALLVDDLQLE